MLLVPKAGIEPAHPKAVDFESTASTDFATSALKYSRSTRKTEAIIPVRSPFATLILSILFKCRKKKHI